ncbi:MAG: chemotaxis protein CheW [Desulfobacteraceae bacterium]|jgi:purine-binding chemotaxis protein CheW|nr:chemotaxis protein CheW [Desulfobacteraceae bacterium]
MVKNIMDKMHGNIKFSTFHIGDAVLGIDILDVQEINKESEITKVPRSLDHIEGVMNLRGRIVTVLNTGKILGLPNARNEKGNRIIIVDSRGEYIGLIVNTVGDIITADENDIEALPSNIGHIKGKYFHGVLKSKGQLIGILDIDELIGESDTEM